MDSLNSSPMLLRRRLKSIGLSDPALDAAWPTWWSAAADASPSARTELKFSLARKLGLDPRSLLDDNATPKFVWRDEARFKHLLTEDEQELSAISSFGKSLANVLIAATPDSSIRAAVPGALDLRRMLLKSRPYIRLSDLLSVAWSLTIPVVHLRVFPCERKRMAAMAVHTKDREAILLGKDSNYPAQIAFYLAHEIGHIALGHLKGGEILVDMDSELESPLNDEEEAAADRFALELLTGQPAPVVLTTAKRYTAKQLANEILRQAADLQIEPGTLCFCFGYSTGDWARTLAAMPIIYPDAKPVWNEINNIALTQLSLDETSADFASYVSAVLGLPGPV